MPEEQSREHLITKSRGVDIFLGVLAGLLVLVVGLVAFAMVSENPVLNNDLFSSMFVAVFAVLAASLPLVLRWSRRAFALGYCGAIAVQCPLLGWLVWRLCQERDAVLGLFAVFSLFSVFTGSRKDVPDPLNTPPAWVSASPVFIGLGIAFVICFWTMRRIRSNRA